MPLDDPITEEETEITMLKLSNGRAAGGDDFISEYLKYGSPVLKNASPTCSIISSTYTNQ
jgi:hypothetical protein